MKKLKSEGIRIEPAGLLHLIEGTTEGDTISPLRETPDSHSNTKSKIDMQAIGIHSQNSPDFKNPLAKKASNLIKNLQMKSAL